jgi:dipeptidyl-peptidase-3
LDRELLWTEGRKLIKDFLVILQTYKSTGAIDRASKFWAHHSKVEGFFLDIREIVLEKKKPRRLELNNNLVRYNESAIEPVLYPERLEAIIHSYSDRYPPTRELCEQVLGVWDEHREHLRVPVQKH